MAGQAQHITILNISCCTELTATKTGNNRYTIIPKDMVHAPLWNAQGCKADICSYRYPACRAGKVIFFFFAVQRTRCHE
jgi:hypothetical protein